MGINDIFSNDTHLYFDSSIISLPLFSKDLFTYAFGGPYLPFFQYMGTSVKFWVVCTSFSQIIKNHLRFRWSHSPL